MATVGSSNAGLSTSTDGPKAQDSIDQSNCDVTSDLPTKNHMLYSALRNSATSQPSHLQASDEARNKNQCLLLRALCIRHSRIIRGQTHVQRKFRVRSRYTPRLICKSTCIIPRSQSASDTLKLDLGRSLGYRVNDSAHQAVYEDNECTCWSCVLPLLLTAAGRCM